MKTKIYLLMLSVYLLIMSIYFYKNQYYNADIEAYMGLVYKNDAQEMSMQDIHKKVFDELKVKNPAIFLETGEPTETIGAESYYPTMASNPKAYEEELAFFSVKPFYNFVNSIFYRLGFPASVSTFLPSILSYIILIFSVFLFLNRKTSRTELAFVLSILISLFKPILDSTRHATPDMLSCLLLLSAFYFFAEKKNIYLSTLFAVLTIFTRPEYFIFFSCLFLLVLGFRRILSFKVFELIASYVIIALAFVIIQAYSEIPWKVLFMNQFTKVQIYPISHPDAFSFADYFRFVKSKIFFEFNSSYFTILLIFCVIIFGKSLYSRLDKSTLLPILLIATIYVSVFIRFLSFPILVNRMMIGFYLLIIMTVIVFEFSRPEKESD